MAPALKNRNAEKHGLYSGSLGKGNAYIRRTVAEFRRALEAACLAERNEISVADAGVIQSAARWETHAQLAAKWLRKNPGLDPEKALKFSREVARASSERDKCIAMLRLSHGKVDAWADILQSTATPTAPQIAPTETQPTENNGKPGQCSSPASTPEGETSASPSPELAAPDAPESTLASAEPNPTDDTNRPSNASEPLAGEATQGNPSNGDQRND